MKILLDDIISQTLKMNMMSFEHNIQNYVRRCILFAFQLKKSILKAKEIICSDLEKNVSV